jgi:hypothetical protein
MDLSNFIIELACLKIKLICSNKLREKQLYVSKIKSWNMRLKNWYVSQCDSEQKNYYPKITSLITDVSDFMDEYSKTVHSGAKPIGHNMESRGLSDKECIKNETLTAGQPADTSKTQVQATVSECSQKYFSNAIQHRINNTVYTDQPSVRIWKISPDQNTVQVLSVSKSNCNESYFNNLLASQTGNILETKTKKKIATLSFNMKTRVTLPDAPHDKCSAVCECCTGRDRPEGPQRGSAPNRLDLECMSYTVLFQDPSETKSMKVNRTMGKFFANAPFFGTPENLRGVYLIYIQKYTPKGFHVYDMTISPADFKKFVHQYRDDMISAPRL